MNTRRHIARFAAGAAAISSLAVGFNVQPAHAQNCEVITKRHVYVEDVEVVEGDPTSTTKLTPLKFYLTTSGCMTESALTFKIMPNFWDQNHPPADADDVTSPSFTPTGIQGTVKWAAGDSSTKVLKVMVRRDNIEEADEGVILLLAPKYGAIDDPNGAEAVILNDDIDPPR